MLAIPFAVAFANQTLAGRAIPMPVIAAAAASRGNSWVIVDDRPAVRMAIITAANSPFI